MRPEKISDVSFSSNSNFHGQDGALRLVIPATERSVRRGLLSIKSGMSDLNLCQDDWSTVELVVAEVLNNIVEHAYSDSTDGLIETHLDYSRHALRCTIIDTGKPMPGGQLPEGAQKDLTCDIEDLPEGGFGWFLIHQLTSHLSYTRHSDKNTVTFMLPFTPQ